MPFTSKRWGDDFPRGHCEHAGLFLLKGFHHWDAEYAGGQSGYTTEQYNKNVVEHHQTAAKILPALYEKAYERWKAHLLELGTECGHWFGDLIGRMYLGLGEASPLEAGISLHHTYGVPMIPGSAVKGVLHHYALRHWDDTKLIELIFGREPDPAKEDGGDAGRVIFNDAWWVIETSKSEACNDKPLVAEVITVHHPKYYGSGGKDAATDFDDPNPNSQIAIRGSFHFSFFADDDLYDVVQMLLHDALTKSGIGAKGSSGYGLFKEDGWKTGEMKTLHKET